MHRHGFQMHATAGSCAWRLEWSHLWVLCFLKLVSSWRSMTADLLWLSFPFWHVLQSLQLWVYLIVFLRRKTQILVTCVYALPHPTGQLLRSFVPDVSLSNIMSGTKYIPGWSLRARCFCFLAGMFSVFRHLVDIEMNSTSHLSRDATLTDSGSSRPQEYLSGPRNPWLALFQECYLSLELQSKLRSIRSSFHIS